MEIYMENRYVILLHDWQEKFRINGRKILKRHNRYLIIDDKYASICFFNKDYMIDLSDGIIYKMDHNPCELQPMAQMMIYSHLDYLRKDAKTANCMEALHSVGSMKSFGSRPIIEVHPPEKALIKKLDEDPGVIDMIIKRFSAEREDIGDISFSLDVFPEVKYQYVYWRGDDEFPSNLNIYVDENLLEYVHPESAGLLAGIGIEMICQEVGVDYQKWSWEI